MMSRQYGLVIMYCALAMAGMAQQLSFDHLTIDQGLSGNTIYTIVQDHDGFMWFGSRYGLNRFDGSGCRVYRHIPGDSLSLPDDHVQALHCDSAGNLWVGLRRGGISVYDRVEQVFRSFSVGTSFPIETSTLSVDAFFEDSRGYLWVGTLGQGVFAFRPGRDSVIHLHANNDRPAHRLSFDHAFSFVEDPNGCIWIGTSGGEIDMYDPKTDSLSRLAYPDNSEYNLGSYSKALLIKGDTLWIGTEGNGLHFYDFRSGEFVGQALVGKLVTDISRDNNGTIWVATDGDGLFVTSSGGQSFEHFTYSVNLRNSLNTNALYSVYSDKQSNVWVGTFNGGVNVYKPAKMEFLTFFQPGNRAEAPGFQSVLALFEERSDIIWIGTDGGGLVRFNRDAQTFETFQASSGELASDVITAIYQDSSGVFWLGTYASGMIRFDPSEKSYSVFMNDIRQPSTIANDNVWAITRAGPRTLWVGTLGGGLDLFDMDTGVFRHMQSVKTRNGSTLGLNVRTLVTDPDGSLWIGTEYNGLYRLSAQRNALEQWSATGSATDALWSQTVLCLLIDREHTLWVGTEGGGLHRMRPDRSGFDRFSMVDGLPSDVIYAMLEDEQGRLWLSTNAGLSVFDPQTGAATNFDKNDGLQSNSFNPNAALTASNGEMYFGGLSGINVFSPGKLPVNANPPQIAFSEISLFNSPVPVSRLRPEGSEPVALNDDPTFELERSENVVTIEFAALEYTNPARNALAYRLLGFESDWTVVPGNTHAVSYTNLDHGNYVFEVRGANNSGLWSDETRRLRLLVRPAFYETVWFQGLIVLLGIGILIGYVRYARHQREQAYQRELMKAREETLRLKNEHLAREVREKNDRLSAALLQSAHKNNSLDDFRKELHDLLREERQDGSRRKELKSLIRKIDSEIDSEDYWQQFQLNFDQVHQAFSHKLLELHPAISTNDVRLCCLIKIGLTNREIASIQNISLSGVEKSKYRLKKKLDLAKDEDLNIYLLKFG